MSHGKPFGLTFIWHDCFVLRLPGVGTVIFDYVRDPREKRVTEPSWVRDLKERNERTYVLVSHHHKDHFVNKIFEWCEGWPELHYIVSKDVASMIHHRIRPDSIWKGKRIPESQISIMRPGEDWSDGWIRIHAYDSTDIGNSYVVEGGGLKVFHAGDLNAWIWKDESTEEEVANEIRRYEEIIDTIVKDFPHLDIAMMPVDSRIGSEYYTGAKILVRKLDIDLFVPMHFGLGDIDDQPRYQADALRFELYANPQRGSYIALTSPGASYLRFG